MIYKHTDAYDREGEAIGPAGHYATMMHRKEHFRVYM
jgi:hypothetical protein